MGSSELNELLNAVPSFEQIQAAYKESSYYEELKKQRRTQPIRLSERSYLREEEPHARPQTVVVPQHSPSIERVHSLTESELAYVSNVQEQPGRRKRDVYEILLKRVEEKEREERRKYGWFWDDTVRFYFAIACIFIQLHDVAYIRVAAHAQVFRPDYLILVLIFVFLFSFPIFVFEFVVGQIFHGTPIRAYPTASRRGLGLALGSLFWSLCAIPVYLGESGIAFSLACVIPSDWDKVVSGSSTVELWPSIAAFISSPAAIAVSFCTVCVLCISFYFVVLGGMNTIQNVVAFLLFTPIFLILIHSIFFLGDVSLVEDFKAYFSRGVHLSDFSLTTWRLAWEDAIKTLPICRGLLSTLSSYNITGAKTFRRTLVIGLLSFIARHFFIGVYTVLLSYSEPRFVPLFPSRIPIIANRLFLCERTALNVGVVIFLVNLIISSFFDLFPAKNFRRRRVVGIVVGFSLLTCLPFAYWKHFPILNAAQEGLFHVIIVLAMLQTFWIGWFVGGSHLIKSVSHYLAFCCIWAACFLGIFLVGLLSMPAYFGLPLFGICCLLSFLPIFFTYYTASQQTFLATLRNYFLGNLDHFVRHLIHPAHNLGAVIQTPWLFIVKYVTPSISAYFTGVFIRDTSSYMSNENVGFVVVILVTIVLLIAMTGLILPQALTWILPDEVQPFDQVILSPASPRGSKARGVFLTLFWGSFGAVKAQLLDFTCPRIAEANNNESS